MFLRTCYCEPGRLLCLPPAFDRRDNSRKAIFIFYLCFSRTYLIEKHKAGRILSLISPWGRETQTIASYVRFNISLIGNWHFHLDHEASICAVMREAGTWIYFHFPNFCDSIYVERALKDIGNKNEQEKLFEKV